MGEPGFAGGDGVGGGSKGREIGQGCVYVAAKGDAIAD